MPQIATKISLIFVTYPSDDTSPSILIFICNISFRSSPLALEAAERLLKLGVSLQEVNSIINGTTTSNKSNIPEW